MEQKRTLAQRVLGDTKPVVHVLVCVFALSSWLDINGLWVELPILVTYLPEKWTLPSYIIALSQLANLGPLTFVVLAKCVRQTRAYKSVLDKVTSYIIMITGLVSTFLLAFLWKFTDHVAGSERSVALLALSFFLALTDCTSSVAYTAFMATLRPQYMATFFLGEGLSGLVPALMALGQGAGEIVCVNQSYVLETVVNETEWNGTIVSENDGTVLDDTGMNETVVNVTKSVVFPVYLPPRFSLQVFFLLLSAIMALSVVAFTLLNKWNFCKDQLVDWHTQNNHEVTKGKQQDLPSSDIEESESQPSEHMAANHFHSASGGASCTNDSFQKSQEQTGLIVKVDCRAESPEFAQESATTQLTNGGGREQKQKAIGDRKELTRVVSTAEVVVLLLQVILINFLITSFLLTIQVYSSLPYGIDTYNLVVTLSNIANPVACIVCLMLTVSSTGSITVLTSLGVACSGYVVVAAAMSPTPPLLITTFGGPLIVIVWVGAAFFLTFAKVAIAGILRHVGRSALIWYGAATQGGALFGALTGFVLVNELKVFTDAPWC